MHKQHNWKVQGTLPWSEETCYWSERGRGVTCGLPEADSTFKHLLVKDRSVRHNCTSQSSWKCQLSMAAVRKLVRIVRTKTKQTNKKNTKCPRRTIICSGLASASTVEPTLYHHEVGGCCPWIELIQMLNFKRGGLRVNASVLPQRVPVFIMKLTDVIRRTVVNLMLLYVYSWHCGDVVLEEIVTNCQQTNCAQTSFLKHF